PLNSMLEAGKYFLRKQKRSVGVSESELIKIAVKSLGLEDLGPFNPDDRIIEYMLKTEDSLNLANMTLAKFGDETASESPAPGGGSISAYVGSLGVSLGTMVANLSSHKRGWDEKWEEYSNWAEKGQIIKDKLLKLVDEDTNAFNRLMAAMRMAKGSDKEKIARKQAIDEATKNAIMVPFSIMKLSLESMEIMEAMAERGIQSSISDAGVGIACARTAVVGAFLNVKINLVDFEDKSFSDKVLKEGQKIQDKAFEMENKILEMIDKKLTKT
ncbi:cyclodeaminase/cyclohydrolase family protein, partial [Bacteroidota bacterium]